MRIRVALSSLVVACSQPASPPPKSPPAIVGTPQPVPAVVSSTAPPAAMIVADGAGFAFEDPARRKKLEAAFPAIDKMIDEELKAQGLAGVAVGIVIDGELVHARGAGATSEGGKTVPDADTVYRIGSITKSFTGLALLALRDDGALQLDDPLAKWVPEAAGFVYPSKDARPITLRQLSNHTSGLPRMGTFDFEAAPTEKVVVESLSSVVLNSAPGTVWEYSNLGFGLLGLAVGRAGKASYHDVVAAKILKPLGMTATTWEPVGSKVAPAYDLGPKGQVEKPVPARLGVVDGAGGIYSTVRDMAKYIAFQLSAYPARSEDDRGVIKRATLREAHLTGVPSGFKHDPPAVAMSYGFGWSQFQTCELDDLVTHNGGIDSYRSEVRFSPSRGVGVVVLSNFPNANPSAFAEKALAELAKTGAMEPRVPFASPQLTKAVERLLVIYHAWDEAAFAKILARPIDPREKDELATYKQLHGSCTTITPRKIESSSAGSFAVKCERGALEFELNLEGNLIGGFVGHSTGIEAPPAAVALQRELVAILNKWDDKRAAKLFTNGSMFAQRATMREPFHTRHGDCKIASTFHHGFDWGVTLACKKEDVEVTLMTAPNEPKRLAGLQLRPRRDAPKKCGP